MQSKKLSRQIKGLQVLGVLVGSLVVPQLSVASPIVFNKQVEQCKEAFVDLSSLGLPSIETSLWRQLALDNQTRSATTYWEEADRLNILPSLETREVFESIFMERIKDEVSEALEDGVYSVAVTLLKAKEEQLATISSCLQSEAQLVVEEGQARLYLSFKPTSPFGVETYVTDCYYFKDQASFEAEKLAQKAQFEHYREETKQLEQASVPLEALPEEIYVQLELSNGMIQMARIKINY